IEFRHDGERLPFGMDHICYDVDHCFNVVIIDAQDFAKWICRILGLSIENSSCVMCLNEQNGQPYVFSIWPTTQEGRRHISLTASW
ncbi:hypothetical protein, partial [Sulfobacillus thermosulfidooxidans]|uniref:hypothetical protein n=1 Tax=Sulfobacillus thermosulfidooxidans TaxID=28034 RepID=UPI001A990B06